MDFVQAAKVIKADEPSKPPKRLYNEMVANIGRQGGGDRPDIPDFNSVSSQLTRARKKVIPPIPHDIDDVQIRGRWRRTWEGHHFIKHQDNDWGVIIFTTDRNLRALTNCIQLYMDATFSTIPAPYQQMFNIVGDYHGRIIPFVSVLMTNRTIGHYRHVLQRKY